MKKVVIQKCEPIKHLFKTDHGFMVENLTFTEGDRDGYKNNDQRTGER